MQERFCIKCQNIQRRELPPLKFQLEEILKMDISREEMNRKLDNLSDFYGYQKFTTCMLSLARSHFRVPNREARYETRERLVYFYVKEYNQLTGIKEYAKMSLTNIIK
ncbi:MAG: hypothetical protein PHY90_12260 [Desulfitobacteriaceae bacterium]|nr:hypothetical protein [Desulfitobacteriaceae bacterium]